MTVRSDTIIAIMLPVIAISWVFADAAAGLVSAERGLRMVPPVVQIVGEKETAATVIAGNIQTPTVICARNGAVAHRNAQTQPHGLPQVNLQLLCRAGLKFTFSLPKI
ncbi:MAG: hypothetical protein O7A62_12655 [Alphaproteobacteria bacterium]|nr:hypothetical protein [Alphaproteobacteria bacterium]MCZ6511423.1 hypothetical protein [Alphaproteobacteria bacterium]